MAASFSNRIVCSGCITCRHVAPWRHQLTTEAVCVTRGSCCVRKRNTVSRQSGRVEQRWRDYPRSRLCDAKSVLLSQKCEATWKHAFWATNCTTHKCLHKLKSIRTHNEQINRMRYLDFRFVISGPPLWSSSHSSWLQIQRSEFDSRRCRIFWEVVGLERSPLGLVNTIEKLLERKNSGFGVENWEYGRRDPSSCPRGTLYPQKFALTSPTSTGRSVGIVRSRTQATELSDSF
jgi:hypothetical protein